MTLTELETLVALGESETLEFKRSTGELREAMQTLCAFANGAGGMVLIGVRPDSRIVGQQISEQTLHELATARDRFEPPVALTLERVELGEALAVLVLSVGGTHDAFPFTYDGRSFERITNTTRRMPQARYETLLLERAHSRRRWENQVADEISLKDIDREEVFRILEAAQSAGRLVGPAGRSLLSVLERLGAVRKGQLLRASVVLFGKTFLPDYPQCELRMARFRGIDKTEFLDQRHIRASAFKLLEEAQLFCQRHFPLPGRIEPDRLERVDRPLIPPDAMREILVNALIHRDYSIAGGAVSLALFDDRVEVWSAGLLPNGITPASLAREHMSVQRNPIIAEVFHRAGLIEKWGRGTNRVAEMCAAAGIRAPEFREITGATVVTFRVPVGTTGSPIGGSRPESSDLRPELEALRPGLSDLRPESEASRPESEAVRPGSVVSRPESEALRPGSDVLRPESTLTANRTVRARSRRGVEDRVVELLRQGPLSSSELASLLGHHEIAGRLRRVLRDLLARGVVERTIPEKPSSRLQKYRLLKWTNDE